MNIPFAVPECRVAHLVERHDDHLVVPVRLDAATGCCPECGQASRSVHSRYHRHPSDLPLSASRTALRIEVRRFYCRNPTCRRRTFAETPTDLLAPHARRTRRLGEAQARVGRACGGAGGARLPHAPPHAGKPRDRAAARHPHADARHAGSHPGRHRRLGDQEGQPLRHDRRRPRPSPRHRSPPGSHGTHGSRLARTALRRRTRRPGSLDRVCPRCKPRHSPGAAGRRSMAPAHQHAAGRRTLAPRGPCPVAEPSTPPWLGRSSRPARPCLRPQHAGTGSGRTELDAMAGCLRRGPPPACRRGAPARDRPCPGAGSCDGAQICERRDVPGAAASRCWTEPA